MPFDLNHIPDWLKGLSALSGWAALVAVVLRYKSDTKGHEVESEKNADSHDEHVIQTLKEFMKESREADQKTREHDQARIKDLEAKLSDLQAMHNSVVKDLATLTGEHITLKGEHGHCQKEIAGLKTQVQSLIDGQAKAEILHERELRVLEDDKRDLQYANETLLTRLSEHDLEAKIERNAAKIEAAALDPSHVETINVRADAVNVSPQSEEWTYGDTPQVEGGKD